RREGYGCAAERGLDGKGYAFSGKEVVVLVVRTLGLGEEGASLGFGDLAFIMKCYLHLRSLDRRANPEGQGVVDASSVARVLRVRVSFATAPALPVAEAVEILPRHLCVVP